MKPKYSIIIPVYKVNKGYFEQCVKSVLYQTYNCIELILVDDGSPDESGQYCDEYAKKDERVVVIHKENGGSASARNAGLRKAQGEWISFIDADDWYESTLFEDIDELTKDDSTDVIMFSCSRDYVNKCEIAPSIYQDKQAIVNLEEREDLQTRMLSVPGKKKQSFVLVSVWSKIYRKTFLINNNIFMNESVRYNEDCLFCLEVYEKMRKLVNTTNYYYHYRTVASSKVNKYRDKCDQEQTMIIQELNNYAHIHDKKDNFRYAIYLRTLVSIQMCFMQKFYHKEYPRNMNRRKRFAELLRTEPFLSAMKNIKPSTLNKHFLFKYICYKYRLFGFLSFTDKVYRKKNNYESFT